jgi:hypothetical protein
MMIIHILPALLLTLVLLLLDTTAFYTHTVYSDVCVCVCVSSASAHSWLYRGIVNTMSFEFGSVTHRREGGKKEGNTFRFFRGYTCWQLRWKTKKTKITFREPFRIFLSNFPPPSPVVVVAAPPHIHYIIDFICVAGRCVCVCVGIRVAVHLVAKMPTGKEIEAEATS